MADRPYGMDELVRASPEAERAALAHLARVAAVFSALALATYVVPGLSPWRPWIPGEAVPIVGLFADRGAHDAESGTEIATGASHGERPSSLESSVLANLEDPGEGGEGPEGSADVPVLPAQRPGQVRVEPAELEGLSREIEDPSGRAMQAFYDALYRTAAGQAGAITRVAHFGDSSIALDGITQTTRQRLQQRFGDAGHGWILAARHELPYRHHGVRHDSEGNWEMMDITHLPLSSGRYGLGGYQARSSSGGESFFATAEEGSPVGTALSRFDVYYERHPRGGRFEVRIDRGERAVVDTRGEPSDEIHRIELPDGPHRLDLRTVGHGESRLYGVVLERSGPGVVYDSLGMVGARARRFLGFDEAHLRRQLALRGTDLIVIGYGGNDADDNREQPIYEDDFRRVAHLVRQARPEASCLLLAPLDQAERDERGRIRTMEAVPRIVAAMRAAALAEGCAFFDTYEAMGGEGAMEEWFRASPRLAFSDFRHATPAGYRVIGNIFYKALLDGFADYLSRR